MYTCTHVSIDIDIYICVYYIDIYTCSHVYINMCVWGDMERERVREREGERQGQRNKKREGLNPKALGPGPPLPSMQSTASAQAVCGAATSRARRILRQDPIGL